MLLPLFLTPVDAFIELSEQVCVRYMFEFHEAASTNKLHLNGFTIPTIPPEVIELTSLTELNMSGSNLSNVVSEIDKLKDLKLLDVSYNRIKLLPPTIGKLKRLETLNVQVMSSTHSAPL